MSDPPENNDDGAHVYMARGTRAALARLTPGRRAALSDGLHRVGRHLLASAVQVDVDVSWAAHTWPRRRYPQQCYPRTFKYVVDHPDIDCLLLVHGVVSHAPHFVPLDHAWVELPGEVVFDGVVQAFFSRDSYYAVMAALPMDTYSIARARQLASAHGHPGPWNASWVPTRAQLQAYAAAVGRLDGHPQGKPRLISERPLRRPTYRVQPETVAVAAAAPRSTIRVNAGWP
jgi:hypothetical protein